MKHDPAGPSIIIKSWWASFVLLSAHAYAEGQKPVPQKAPLRSEAALDSFAFELLSPGIFHGDEVAATSRQGWFALIATEGKGYALKKVSLEVKTVYDAVFDHEKGPFTGKEVIVKPVTQDRILALMRPAKSAFLKAGPIEGRGAQDSGTLSPGQIHKVPFRGQNYVLKASAKAVKQEGETSWRGYEITLESGDRSQNIFQAGGGEAESIGNDAMPNVVWTGDLDGDLKLDLLLDLTTHYNVSRLTLFLSSAAASSELVKQVAQFETTGC